MGIKYGGVAQQLEHALYMGEIIGATPFPATIIF